MRHRVSTPSLPSAYTTVTDGERFAELHAAAASLFERLAATHVCVVSGHLGDARGLPPTVTHARPPITLTPRGGGAPLSVAFLSPIGVWIRCGWWYAEGFPSCACDACGLTVDGEAEKLTHLCESVVAGGFQESLEIPRWFGEATQSHSFTLHGALRGGSSVLPRALARERWRGGPAVSAWQPWERREP